MEALPSPRVLVIMPAWNEGAVVGSTVREVLHANARYDVLVVNDGSTDSTAEEAAAAGATVLNLPFNLGVGGAMRAGFKYAQRLGYAQVIQVDSDGQHDPRNIDEVLAGLQHADISIGARFADRGEYKVTGPRKWAMQLLAKVISGLAKTRLTDVTSGFRAANERAVAQYLDHYPAEYLGDTIDSLVVPSAPAARSRRCPWRCGHARAASQATTPSRPPFTSEGPCSPCSLPSPGNSTRLADPGR